jgi:hypothetical protein
MKRVLARFKIPLYRPQGMEKASKVNAIKAFEICLWSRWDSNLGSLLKKRKIERIVLRCTGGFLLLSIKEQIIDKKKLNEVVLLGNAPRFN